MPEIQNKMTVFAPAKVNLHLAVKDRREDGYHNLESLFIAVDFGDFLYFSLNKNDDITEIVMKTGLEVNEELVSNSSFQISDNIIYKAVTLFRGMTGFNKGIKIEVDKRIPIGGGLGGGSSNAASTLLALNKIAGNPLDRKSLLEAAVLLGSDVPFFIHETPAAWVKGRGEIIEPVDAPRMFFTLVNPGFSSETAAAFKLLDKYRESGLKNEEFGINLGFLNDSAFHIPHSTFRNDFLPVFKDREKSAYLKIISQLRDEGAFYANLSGAGSTCFGIFDDVEKARKTADYLNNKWKFVKLSGIWHFS